MPLPRLGGAWLQSYGPRSRADWVWVGDGGGKKGPGPGDPHSQQALARLQAQRGLRSGVDPREMVRGEGAGRNWGQGLRPARVSVPGPQPQWPGHRGTPTAHLGPREAE